MLKILNYIKSSLTFLNPGLFLPSFGFWQKRNEIRQNISSSAGGLIFFLLCLPLLPTLYSFVESSEVSNLEPVPQKFLLDDIKVILNQNESLVIPYSYTSGYDPQFIPYYSCTCSVFHNPAWVDNGLVSQTAEWVDLRYPALNSCINSRTPFNFEFAMSDSDWKKLNGLTPSDEFNVDTLNIVREKPGDKVLLNILKMRTEVAIEQLKDVGAFRCSQNVDLLAEYTRDMLDMDGEVFNIKKDFVTELLDIHRMVDDGTDLQKIKREFAESLQDVASDRANLRRLLGDAMQTNYSIVYKFKTNYEASVDAFSKHGHEMRALVNKRCLVKVLAAHA